MKEERIRWIDAWFAPKVFLYGCSFFFIKFSIYAILLWMPLFLSSQLDYDNGKIAKLLTFYEISTLIGTVALGLLTDIFYAKRSPVTIFFVISASIIAFILALKYD